MYVYAGKFAVSYCIKTLIIRPRAIILFFSVHKQKCFVKKISSVYNVQRVTFYSMLYILCMKVYIGVSIVHVRSVTQVYICWMRYE